jgi:hypothetical protein
MQIGEEVGTEHTEKRINPVTIPEKIEPRHNPSEAPAIPAPDIFTPKKEPAVLPEKVQT